MSNPKDIIEREVSNPKNMIESECKSLFCSHIINRIESECKSFLRGHIIKQDRVATPSVSTFSLPLALIYSALISQMVAML